MEEVCKRYVCRQQLPAKIKLAIFSHAEQRACVGTGLAEVARTLFAVAGRFPGKGFEDVRLNGDQFAAKKKAGELAQNLNRMPILNHNGAVIGQSSAINNHLAQQFGLLGTNSVEAAQIEAMVGHIKDVFGAYRKLGKYGLNCVDCL